MYKTKTTVKTIEYFTLYVFICAMQYVTERVTSASWATQNTVI